MSVLPSLTLALLLAAPAAASSTSVDHRNDAFGQRVRRAHAAEVTAAGTAWQHQLWQRIGTPMTDALKSCLVSNAPADKAPFTLVADVDADGRPVGLAVQPSTALARCTAGQFAAWTLPLPPPTPRPYPIEIDVSISR